MVKNVIFSVLPVLLLMGNCGGASVSSAGTVGISEGAVPASSSAVGASPQPQTVIPRIVAEYPHDAKAYTQGLLFDSEGKLYESTGEYGQSSLRLVDPVTGVVERSVSLPDLYFGEGLALVGDSLLYQLTWQEQRCFVYRKSDFRQVGMFAYSGEGWGLAPNEIGDSLYMSDGSAWVRVLDPKDFSQGRRFQVQDNNGPVLDINELEWIGGRLWANLYLTDKIAVIDAQTGYVTHYIDCSALETRISHRRDTDVFNGIACDPVTGRIFVTGKKWDKLFEIKVAL